MHIYVLLGLVCLSAVFADFQNQRQNQGSGFGGQHQRQHQGSGFGGGGFNGGGLGGGSFVGGGGGFDNGGLNNGGFNNGGFNNGGFNNGGFNNGDFQGDSGVVPVPVAENSMGFQNDALQVQKQAQGNSAAAGNAGTLGAGQSSSINQAQHQADRDNTAASSLSANTAQGFGPSANGAAQASGQLDQQVQRQGNSGFQGNGFGGRRRR